MTLLYHSVKNQPEEQKTAETRAMIETFNTAVDFVDFRALEPIAGGGSVNRCWGRNDCGACQNWNAAL